MFRRSLVQWKTKVINRKIEARKSKTKTHRRTTTCWSEPAAYFVRCTTYQTCVSAIYPTLQRNAYDFNICCCYFFCLLHFVVIFCELQQWFCICGCIAVHLYAFRFIHMRALFFFIRLSSNLLALILLYFFLPALARIRFKSNRRISFDVNVLLLPKPCTRVYSSTRKII